MTGPTARLVNAAHRLADQQSDRDRALTRRVEALEREVAELVQALHIQADRTRYEASR